MTATGPCQPRRGFIIPDVTQALMDKNVATIKKESAKNNNVKMEILKVYKTCQIFTYSNWLNCFDLTNAQQAAEYHTSDYTGRVLLLSAFTQHQIEHMPHFCICTIKINSVC